MAGETGGNIAAAFQAGGRVLHNRDRLARKIKKAVAYPAFVFGFVVLVVVVIIDLIIPRFQEMFKSFGTGKLPPLLRSLWLSMMSSPATGTTSSADLSFLW